MIFFVKPFSKCYHRNLDLISKYKCTLKTFLRQGIAHPIFYGDVLYKLRKIRSQQYFKDLFPKTNNEFIKSGYNPDVLQRTACMVIFPSTVDHYASLFDCATTRNPLHSMKT